MELAITVLSILSAPIVLFTIYYLIIHLINSIFDSDAKMSLSDIIYDYKRQLFKSIYSFFGIILFLSFAALVFLILALLYFNLHPALATIFTAILSFGVTYLLSLRK